MLRLIIFSSFVAIFFHHSLLAQEVSFKQFRIGMTLKELDNIERTTQWHYDSTGTSSPRFTYNGSTSTRTLIAGDSKREQRLDSTTRKTRLIGCDSSGECYYISRVYFDLLNDTVYNILVLCDSYRSQRLSEALGCARTLIRILSDRHPQYYWDRRLLTGAPSMLSKSDEVNRTVAFWDIDCSGKVHGCRIDIVISQQGFHYGPFFHCQLQIIDTEMSRRVFMEPLDATGWSRKH